MKPNPVTKHEYNITQHTKEDHRFKLHETVQPNMQMTILNLKYYALCRTFISSG